MHGILRGLETSAIGNGTENFLLRHEAKPKFQGLMKAIAVYPQQRQVKLIDTQAPTLSGHGQVRLRMLEVGICGTDKEICSFQYGTPPQGSDHFILGHESLGEVVEVGSAVEGLRVGDLVVPTVRRPCPHESCIACRQGRQDFCYTGDFLERGIKGLDGFMAEQVVEQARYLNVVPAALREVAVLVEPLTIAEKALTQVLQVQQRLPWTAPGAARAVVLGAGPVGLLGAMVLTAAGFQTFVYSREKPPHPKAELAESFGARYLSSQTVPVKALAEHVGNIDVVYEAVGASRLAFDVMRVLGTNGVFVFTGVPGRKSPVPVDTDSLMRSIVLKNQVALGTVNASKDSFDAAIRDLGLFMQRWPEAVRALITQRVSVEQYTGLLLGQAPGIKNVLRMS
jgi:threonine dehydrogenase-like Zn-dependent dehydrogenase